MCFVPSVVQISKVTFCSLFDFSCLPIHDFVLSFQPTSRVVFPIRTLLSVTTTSLDHYTKILIYTSLLQHPPHTLPPTLLTLHHLYPLLNTPVQCLGPNPTPPIDFCVALGHLRIYTSIPTCSNHVEALLHPVTAHHPAAHAILSLISNLSHIQHPSSCLSPWQQILRPSPFPSPSNMSVNNLPLPVPRLPHPPGSTTASSKPLPIHSNSCDL